MKRSSATRERVAVNHKHLNKRNHCPRCFVTNIRWRIKKESFICNRCGQEFDDDGNMLPITPARKEA
jgi:ribosomal protein L37AE/L43A